MGDPPEPDPPEFPDDPPQPSPGDIPNPLQDGKDDEPDLGDLGTITPAAPTSITLNPKVSGEATVLRCPECEEVIEAVELPQPDGFDDLVEYRCGCDKLRKFRVRGAGDSDA